MSQLYQGEKSTSLPHSHLCQLLHIVLILLYAAAVMVASHQYEHGLNYAFTTAGQTSMSFTVSAVAQTFSTVYLAVLVLVTQRLALIRDLHTRQTPTAIHDKSSAWLGLGSSLVTLLDQTRVPAAVSSVVFIAIWLGGVAILHIAIPASVSVSVYNHTVATQQQTQLARPDHQSSLDFVGGAAWDILAVYDQFQQIGLLDNMIYDIIPTLPTAENQATVNATIFTANCGTVNASQAGGALAFSRYSVDKNWWTLDLSEGSDLGVLIPVMSYQALVTSAPLGSDVFQSTAAIVVASSTISIVDAAGDNATLVAIHPQLIFDGLGPHDPLRSIQLFACNINSQNITVDVSATTRTPVDQAATSGDVFWSEWILPENSTDPLLFDISTISSSSPASSHGQGNSASLLVINADDATLNGSKVDMMPTMLDDFLMSDLRITDPRSNVSQTGILLSDFQLSLGKAVAAMVWYERNRNLSDIYSLDSDSWNFAAYQNRTGQATVEVNVLRMRLNLNIMPLAVGLVVSCVLFAMTFALSIHPRRDELTHELNAAGILQLTWLLGKDSHFERLRRPGRQELREAGMFEVEMSSWVRRRGSALRTSTEEEELTELSVSKELYDSNVD
ncbi:hypothetical protein BC835DRAFT_1423689 [Cytidiella melzeri]|nr:hypothetical protein BC835DRAFT_1423689 [Cytidiella melzeri]